jgi:hypothetical protein
MLPPGRRSWYRERLVALNKLSSLPRSSVHTFIITTIETKRIKIVFKNGI